jgi:hypothetical protein
VFSPKNENFDHIPENAKGILGELSQDIADDRVEWLSRKLKR